MMCDYICTLFKLLALETKYFWLYVVKVIALTSESMQYTWQTICYVKNKFWIVFVIKLDNYLVKNSRKFVIVFVLHWNMGFCMKWNLHTGHFVYYCCLLYFACFVLDNMYPLRPHGVHVEPLLHDMIHSEYPPPPPPALPWMAGLV